MIKNTTIGNGFYDTNTLATGLTNQSNRGKIVASFLYKSLMRDARRQ